jgi:hypothetical protein
VTRAVLLLALLLAACAGAGARYSDPRARAAEQVREDLAACQDQAQVVRDPVDRQTWIDNCMGEQGYGLAGPVRERQREER